MVARSQNYSSEISVIIDPETILLPNFLTTLHCAYKLDRDWFLVSMIPSVSNFPFHMDDTGNHWLKEDGASIGIGKLQEYAIKELQWSNCGEKLVMAWNRGDVPLYSGILPPFLHGKGFYNSWVLHEVLSSEFRLVIDGSYIVSAIYPQADTANDGWEVKGNNHLAVLYGSLYSGEQNKLTTDLKFIKCLGKHFLFDSVKKVVFYHEGSSRPFFSFKDGMAFLLTWPLHFGIQQRLIRCIDDLNFLGIECFLKKIYNIAFTEPLTLSIPFDLESLLQITADKDKTIVLAVAGDNYREMLMSWVCQLRHLAVSNFIVCALDAETYQFALLMGLPVFMDPLAPSNISFNDCHFGTNCFQRVTKVKSRIVLQILKMGYNVLLSDVDVYWFSNPLTYLQSFGPAILVTQSDEYNETGPINLPRRLNSGFYFTRSDPPTIAAMEKVVKHALTSTLSEQPSFYDVLCGEGGINRVDDNHCLEPGTNLTIHFLDRNLFPNGAYKGLWEKRNVRSYCKKQGCIILHNNWVSGRKRKLERQVHSGLWEYDSAQRMCLQSWHQTSLTSHSF
ncbi:beta-arabinofuranosyltransferase RAY1 [Dendrobium catenatum]|nr:beta-arabinofuranosyltransferase RAY1 [Dendrobium catenatum]